ncbi:MAG: hypothetical protein NZ555_07360 [Geminicoccaceae bacterium]|nr:hypothetical protein [Geminicoccaceae bacterium]MCX8101578.1 hypothetical protein [Geminicoccaceae bacterium]MDW8369875.1 hypothetical protein [Geminicoccaceae bacterium]
MEALLGTSLPVFLGLTVVLVGAAAWLTGRAMAEHWRGPWHVLAACLGLAVAARFLTFALFRGELWSLSGFLASWLVLSAIGLLGFRITHVARMVRQYPWRFRRVSPFAYEEIEPGRGDAGRP